MKTTKKSRRLFDPQHKITAVLSVWTERRTSSQLCREMGISPALLGQWQNQAIEGMLTALSPKRPAQQSLLPTRLSRLIEKNLPDPAAKLQKRLMAVEKARAS